MNNIEQQPNDLLQPDLHKANVGCYTVEMAKDFLRLIGVFLLLVIVTMIVLPINIYWAFIGAVFLVISVYLQLFWNKHFKLLFENDAAEV